MGVPQIIIVGGGAAGFFAGITAAEAGAGVTMLERSSRLLAKVRISGGGRCNVTHACFDAREFVTRYPRGSRELIGAMHRFQARHTVDWFASRNVALKTEPDGRMFPVTDSSETIVSCLLQATQQAGVRIRTNCEVVSVRRIESGFELATAKAEHFKCDCLLLATGGCRSAGAGGLAAALGHTIVEPVPSLFTFSVAAPWLNELAGISLEHAEVSIPGTSLRERGPVLVTHWGLSGPAVLRLSAWGAPELHKLDYKFPLVVNWLPHLGATALTQEFQNRRQSQGAKLVVNAPVAPLTARLWEALVQAAGLPREIRWAALTRPQQQQLIHQLTHTQLMVTSKSLNKDEFVTCGGVKLREVDFKTMESRICPGLYFAGELLDIDGITGGFNFQAAWTTGWIAGKAMAGS